MTARGLLLRLLAVGLSLLLVVAAGEIGLRLVEPRPGFAATALDTQPSSGRHLPDFRGRPRPRAKPPGRFRVLALGDSFAWGYGVHAADAWPLRLERRLAAARPELELEVVNWSRTGWNTEQIWHSLEPRLASLRPDLVILGFTLNDSEPTRRAERDRLLEPLQRRTPRTAVSRALHRGSALYRLFWERFENRRQRRAFVEHYEGLFRGPSWRSCREAMAELRAACAEVGAPLVLVIFPVFDSQLDDSYPYRRLHSKVASTGRDLDIEVLDLLLGFRDLDGRRLALTPFTDPHPSELAHRIAADAIAAYLVQGGLVPAGQPAEPEV